jgi:hypothetical protein
MDIVEWLDSLVIDILTYQKIAYNLIPGMETLKELMSNNYLLQQALVVKADNRYFGI